MSDRPHVLFFTDDPGAGGVAQYNHAILCALAARGFRITCVQSQSDSPLVRCQGEAGVRHRWLGYDTLRDLQTQLTDVVEPPAIFEQDRPDLVFFSNGCRPSLLAARGTAVEMNLPFLIVEGFA